MSIHGCIQNIGTTERKSACDGAPQLSRSLDSTGPSSRILWYRNDIGPRLSDETRALFETYSGISGEELIEHLHNVVSEVQNS